MPTERRHTRYALLLLAFLPFAIWAIVNKSGGEETQQAFLSSDSVVPIFFALLSLGAYLAIAWFVFDREHITIKALLRAAAFTGSTGIALVLVVQVIARNSMHEEWSGSGDFVILHYILSGIAYAYQTSNHSEAPIIYQIIGYVFGVGLCEELTKQLPVLYRLRQSPNTSEANARLLGFMCGVGFGVGEGILYSFQQYDGSSPAMIYAVRFISCVGMHGLSAAVAAGLIVQHNAALGWGWAWFRRLVWTISPAILIHALYDTCSDRNMLGLALFIELVLFALLARQIEPKTGKAYARTSLT